MYSHLPRVINLDNTVGVLEWPQKVIDALIAILQIPDTGLRKEVTSVIGAATYGRQ